MKMKPIFFIFLVACLDLKSRKLSGLGENPKQDQEEGTNLPASKKTKKKGENIDSMRVDIRGRKWWFPLFAFSVDAACQNAWLICLKPTGPTGISGEMWQPPTCKNMANLRTLNSASGVPVQLRVPTEVKEVWTIMHISIPSSESIHPSAYEKMCAKCNVGLHLVR